MEKLQTNLARSVPLGKTGLAEDIAEAALYLASEAGALLTVTIWLWTQAEPDVQRACELTQYRSRSTQTTTNALHGAGPSHGRLLLWLATPDRALQHR